MFLDITARRQAEAHGVSQRRTAAAAHRQRRRLRDFHDDTRPADIDSWNTGAERMFGYTSDEIVGRNFDALFTAEDRARGDGLNELETARRDGRALDERFHAAPGRHPVLCQRRHDAAGRRAALGFAKIARDLTAQQQAAHALRDAHSALEGRVAERTRELATR